MGNTTSNSKQKKTLKEMEIENERMKLTNEKKKMELHNEQKKMELHNEQKKMELQDERKKMELHNEQRKGELDRAKDELDLRTEEMRSKYRMETGKANLEHRHKLNELIAQMEQSKATAGKEILLSFMGTINSTIQQNDTIHEKVIKLSQLFNNDNLPETTKKATEKEIERLYSAYKTPQEILIYIKQQINESQLNQDSGLKQVMNLAVEKDLITEEDKLYLTNGDA